MARDNRITSYDLQLASGATISACVWATTYALAHKGFEIDVAPARDQLLVRMKIAG